MAAGEGVEPSASESKSDVLPFTPSCKKDSGHWESNPEPCASPALTPLIRRLLCRLSYAPLIWSRRKDSDLRRSIIDRVHCRLCYTAMVDPAGLKPAPHGLKGRCSVARAPDRKNGCGGRTRTFDNRINNPVPYQLGYATRNWLQERESNLPSLTSACD